MEKLLNMKKQKFDEKALKSTNYDKNNRET